MAQMVACPLGKRRAVTGGERPHLDVGLKLSTTGRGGGERPPERQVDLDGEAAVRVGCRRNRAAVRDGDRADDGEAQTVTAADGPHTCPDERLCAYAWAAQARNRRPLLRLFARWSAERSP